MPSGSLRPRSLCHRICLESLCNRVFGTRAANGHTLGKARCTAVSPEATRAPVPWLPPWPSSHYNCCSWACSRTESAGAPGEERPRARASELQESGGHPETSRNRENCIQPLRVHLYVSLQVATICSGVGPMNPLYFSTPARRDALNDASVAPEAMTGLGPWPRPSASCPSSRSWSCGWDSTR